MGVVASGVYCVNSCKEQSHQDSAWVTTVENNSTTRETNSTRELPPSPLTHSLMSCLKCLWKQQDPLNSLSTVVCFCVNSHWTTVRTCHCSNISVVLTHARKSVHSFICWFYMFFTLFFIFIYLPLLWKMFLVCWKFKGGNWHLWEWPQPLE